VNDDLHIIEHDPLAGGKPVDGNGPNVVFVSQSPFDFSSDRFQMRLRRSRANHKVIGEAGDALKIEDDNVLCFFVRRAMSAGFG
jgi:hypothetical protein